MITILIYFQQIYTERTTHIHTQKKKTLGQLTSYFLDLSTASHGLDQQMKSASGANHYFCMNIGSNEFSMSNENALQCLVSGLDCTVVFVLMVTVS